MTYAIGALGGTRTPTILLTATSRQRVYQFRHERWEIGLPLFAARPINGADVTNRDWGYKARDGFESVEIWTGSGLIWYQASAATSA